MKINNHNGTLYIRLIRNDYSILLYKNQGNRDQNYLKIPIFKIIV